MIMLVLTDVAVDLWSGFEKSVSADLILGTSSASSSNDGALRDAEYPFIAIAPRSNLAWRGST